MVILEEQQQKAGEEDQRGCWIKNFLQVPLWGQPFRGRWKNGRVGVGWRGKREGDVGTPAWPHEAQKLVVGSSGIVNPKKPR